MIRVCGMRDHRTGTRKIMGECILLRLTKTKMTKKQIDYYGIEDNYIHLKFGDCMKAYNFTEDFRKEYPQFVKAYDMYWEGKRTAFKNPFQVVSYAFNNKIPVNWYYNFTDTPAKDQEEITKYLLQENDVPTLYDHQLK
jgi:hypothetical protein